MAVTLKFDEGTLVIHAEKSEIEPIRELVTEDTRIGAYRAPAYKYEQIVRCLYAGQNVPLDEARAYSELKYKLDTAFTPMPHQRAALAAWLKAKCRGIVALPTGSGKTFFAFLAIAAVKRSAIVVVPTIDLLQQWAGLLERNFHCHVGMLGGGSSEVCDLTVSTYDSAVIRMPQIGNRFGLIVFDECHHLPGEVTRTCASMCLAPYRLGISATPDTGETFDVMRELIGELVYNVGIRDLKGEVLSPYRTVCLSIPLTEQERAEYDENRSVYISFIRSNGISFQNTKGWNSFIALSSRSSAGRRAYQAYLKQRDIARCGIGKLREVWHIIRSNPDARTIVFTADNDTAYRLGNALCAPVLTHKTKAAERKDFLDRFRAGEYPVLVTSKVLNEGVDVPEANIAIVVSGSGTTREHVQRLGRILRRAAGKEAVLYELVSEDTGEVNISERRRNDDAYNDENMINTGINPDFNGEEEPPC